MTDLELALRCLIDSKLDFEVVFSDKAGEEAVIEAYHDPIEDEWIVSGRQEGGLGVRFVSPMLRVVLLDRDPFDLGDENGKVYCIQGLDDSRTPASGAPVWVEMPRDAGIRLSGGIDSGDAALDTLIGLYKEHTDAMSIMDRTYNDWAARTVALRRLQHPGSSEEDEE